MLVRPDPRYRSSVLAAVAEFGGSWVDGSGQNVHDRAGIEEPRAFERYVATLLADADPATPRPADRVPCTFLWMADGDEVVGFLAIRHELNEFLLREGGHIGYSVRPSARRRGWASRSLAEALPIAHGLGIDPVLVTCDETNVGSRAVIEAAGGVYEDSRAGKRRYWIATGPATRR
ncbi:GNAT family N-acetyltransferase [Mesorhizobium japonicum]|uniref:GNAT family N-acetyltransferase n=1 Tax=Mesorhizobium japonicum TaxID=2066070 RepID=UPI003B5C775C